MPTSKTKADTDPKIAQNGPTWAQYGVNMAQNVPTEPKMAQDKPNMVPTLAKKMAPTLAKYGPNVRDPKCPNNMAQNMVPQTTKYH